MKICIVSSGGGHLTEIREFMSVYEGYNYFYVINSRINLPEDMSDRTIFVAHSERDWKFVVNLYEAFVILFKERPNIIFSTGAGVAVPFSLVGKYLFGITVIYVETVTKIYSPSLTGKIMYYIADDFFYQWKYLKKFFPKGKFFGALL